jgi:drug/metabolite transporter (DMT)-like permease
MTRRGWTLFAVMSVIWGTPYLLIKVAVDEVAPPVVVAFRTGVAAMVLVPLAGARGALMPALRRWRPLALFTLLEMAGPWILLVDAERVLASSLTGLLVATVPLVGTLVSFILGDRSALRPVRLAGLVVGFVGVALVVGFGGDGSAAVRPIIEVLLVAVGYAVAPFILDRKLSDVPGIGVIAVALGAVFLLYLGPAIATAPSEMPSAQALGALLGLAVLCTGIAFIIFFALIAEVGPARATLITFVNPAVALGLGVVFLHEPLTTGLVLGFPLVLAGCWLASQHSRPADAPPGAGEPEPVPELVRRPAAPS